CPQGQNGRRAQNVGVVQRQHLGPTPDDVPSGVELGVLLEKYLERLVRVAIEVRTGQRRVVAELVLNLDLRRVGLVRQRGGAGDVGAAVGAAALHLYVIEIVRDVPGDRVDAIGRNPVPRERFANVPAVS